ncbi:hypothetical protein, partial [Acidomonas methanolica]|uniref:hypothetical protein n=1 Tax=Acidomonas methanolica TaxID=437 RepID=UPI001955410E
MHIETELPLGYASKRGHFSKTEITDRLAELPGTCRHACACLSEPFGRSDRDQALLCSCTSGS